MILVEWEILVILYKVPAVQCCPWPTPPAVLSTFSPDMETMVTMETMVRLTMLIIKTMMNVIVEVASKHSKPCGMRGSSTIIIIIAMVI